MAKTPMRTPMIAVSSGMPAATSEPKVRIRTTAEIAMPMSSALPPISCSAMTASPPVSTASPASRVSSVALVRASRDVSVSSVAATLYVTEVYAVVPSLLTVFHLVRVVDARRLRALADGRDHLLDLGLGLGGGDLLVLGGAYDAPGHSRRRHWSRGSACSRRSKAFCDSVPGIENESSGGAGAVEAATPAPNEERHPERDAASRRRRKARRPSLYRNVATAKGTPVGLGRQGRPPSMCGLRT
ncbi:hypothetical protein SALBM135S_09183 [Streptomyces alboniger]